MSYEPKQPCITCRTPTYPPDLDRPGRCKTCRRVVERRSYEKNRAQRLVSQARFRAKAKQLPFDLDEHLGEIVERLKLGRCEMTGLAFDLEHRSRRSFHAPSLDRRRPAEGYVIGNVRLICWGLNTAMADWGEETLREAVAAWLSQPKS